MKYYVVGFPISLNNQVLLIKKNRPEWQKGRYNGIGGHIEKGETPLQCIIRECKEETGLITFEQDWINTVIYSGSDYIVHFYISRPINIKNYIQETDEWLKIFDISDIPNVDTIYNLKWIIPLSLDISIQKPVFIKE